MKGKQVRDSNQATLGGAKKESKNGTEPEKAKDPVQITNENASLLTVKMLEAIANSLHGVKVEVAKLNMMMGDIVKKLREDG